MVGLDESSSIHVFFLHLFIHPSNWPATKFIEHLLLPSHCWRHSGLKIDMAPALLTPLLKTIQNTPSSVHFTILNCTIGDAVLTIQWLCSNHQAMLKWH